MSQILWLPEVNLTYLVTLAVVCLFWFGICISYKLLQPFLFLLLGLLYASVNCYFQLQEQIKIPSNENLNIRVDSLPKLSNIKSSFIGTDIDSDRSYLVNHYDHSSVRSITFKTGEIYQLNVNIKPPHGSVNGVGFDREKWLFRNGIDGLANIKTIDTETQSSDGFNAHVNRWRSSISQLINQYFKNPKTNALIHALSIGDKSHFEYQDLSIFQNTGTAHLIAISGLHIGMVALLGWMLGNLLFRLIPQERISKPVIKVICGLFFASLYASLAGLGVSTLRALIMLSVYGFYLIRRRTAYAWDVWSMALFLTLLVDPMNVLDGGFWLSFIAVAILILAFNGVNNQRHPITNFILMQWTLLIGMMPLSLAIFSKVNLMAPLVNLIMIPVMTFLLIPLLLMLLLFGSLFQTFPVTLVAVIEHISQYSLLVFTWFDQFSTWSLNITIQHGWQYLLLIVAAICLVLPRAWPQRYLGLAFIFMSLFPNKETIPHGQFAAHILDVGQGLSVIIKTQNHAALYDVGAAFDSGFNMADAVILPFLQQRKIKALNTLILSHQDNDHSGAAPNLLNQMSIADVYGTESTHQACLAGHSWSWDGVKFTFLSPYNLSPYLKNNSSCVLMVDALDTSFLLTGDIEDPVEYRLTHNNPELIQADVMLVPHHGSKTSSTNEFIQTVNPQIAINSSGQFNPFNHPADTVKSRYTQSNIAFHDTQNAGLITLKTYPQLNIASQRDLQPRIWRKKKPD